MSYSNMMPGSEGMPGGDDDPEPNCPDCGGDPETCAHCDTCDGNGFVVKDYDDYDDWRWDPPHGGEG